MRGEHLFPFGFKFLPQPKFVLAVSLYVVCLALSLCWMGTATAQSQLPATSSGAFDNMFGDIDAAAPQAISFSSEARNMRFVLDRSQPRVVLLRFDGDPEIWALTSHWGPRGDEFLRNDVGEVMVRITTLGGVTLFGPVGANGAPASVSGKARTLSTPTRSENTLQATVERAITWFGGIGHRSIRIEAAGGLAPPLVHEALRRAAQGISRAPRGFLGQPKKRIRLIRVERAARRPNVSLDRNVLTIGVVPGAGYAGRPSSAAVLAAIKRDK